MSTQAEVSNVFEQVFDSFRKTADASLKMQQDMLRQWSAQWPGFSQPQASWVEQVQKFQKGWSANVVELMRKNRETLDTQHKASIQALEDAFDVAQSKDPEEFRKRAEELCRKSIDCVKEISETQMREFQAAMTKWVELIAKAGPTSP